MSYQILSGNSQRYYHTIPSDLDVITTAPTRKSIFESLSQISYKEFPEFVLDVLTKIEKHQSVDITDGQGDEKQDILTIDANGERCLIQCKHTINYKSHYNGDDLDLMYAACMRKKCKSAIFVTNSDLTPQAKRYITDNEYSRGWPGKVEDSPTIDYWNDSKIWEKIKGNPDIINKWFGGLGQTHGVRSFKFDLSIQQMPYDPNCSSVNDVLTLLASKPWAKSIVDDLIYEANFSDQYKVRLKRWFQFTDTLDLNFILPEDDVSFLNQPLYALTIEVEVAEGQEKFNPKSIRDDIVSRTATELLTLKDKSTWLHLTCSQLKSFIYLHDVGEPNEVSLDSAKTYIMVDDNRINGECEHVSLGEGFSSKDDEQSLWLHNETQIQVVQLFNQKIHPVEQYHYQLIQYKQLNKYLNYDFHAVREIDTSMMMRIRRILGINWVALQHNDNSLIWGIPPEDDPRVVDQTHLRIKGLGLEILEVNPDSVEGMLKSVQADIIPSNWMYHSEVDQLSFPVSLDLRIQWLSKDLEIKGRISEEKMIDLLTYKYNFENQFGYDHLEGKQNQQLNTNEIRSILFDLFTIRGKRMLDISLNKNPISINVRYNEKKLDSSSELVDLYIHEFQQTYNELDKLIHS